MFSLSSRDLGSYMKKLSPVQKDRTKNHVYIFPVTFCLSKLDALDDPVWKNS